MDLVMTTNRHPVDELADVREQIKKLEARERELRNIVLSRECSFVGDEYEAAVVMQRRSRLDTREIKRQLGLEALQRFMMSTEVAIVKLARLGNGDSHEWTD
jgi:hypothetical protein